MTTADRDRDPDQWRDEAQLPLAELTEALGVYSSDGQRDDATGGDAGAEDTFGQEPFAVQAGDQAGDSGHDPDPDTEAGRALRPSPEGRSGPV